MSDARWRRTGRHAGRVMAAAAAMTTMAVGCLGPAPAPTGPPRSDALPTPIESATPTAVATIARSPGLTPGGTPAARTGRLALLSGRPGAMDLEIVAPAGGRRSLIAPDRDVAWISTDADGRILATTRDGRAYLSTAIQTRPRADLDGARRAGDRSGDPRRAAGRSGACPTTGRAPRSSPPTTGPTVRSSSWSSPPRPVRPRSWRWPIRPRAARRSGSATRLAVLTRARGDAPGVVVVDPARTGPSSAGATRADRVGSLSISGDGRVAAFAADGDGPIEIGSAGSWLRGEPTRVRSPSGSGPTPTRARHSRGWRSTGLVPSSRSSARTPTARAPRSPSTRRGRAGLRSPGSGSRPGRRGAVVAWLP